jgi:hypothetical protein
MLRLLPDAFRPALSIFQRAPCPMQVLPALAQRLRLGFRHRKSPLCRAKGRAPQRTCACGSHSALEGIPITLLFGPANSPIPA